MKFQFITPSNYGTSILVAIILAVIGHLLGLLFGIPSLAGKGSFALGLGLGALLVPVLHGIRVSGFPGMPGVTGDGAEMHSIFIGNLAYRASREELAELFQPYGTVHSVRIMTDRMTRRPRGFAFVEMPAGAARKAIKNLDGTEFHGRTLKVSEGRSRDEQDTE